MADPDYFTLVEFRALPDCGGSAFMDAQVLAAAAYFTEIVEREVGLPLVPRSFTEKFNGDCRLSLVLSQPRVRSLTSVTVDGVTVDVALLSARSGVLRYLDRSTVWPRTAEDDVVVTYTAGEATCPADIKDAVMWATRDRLLSQSDQNGVDIRRTSMTTDFGVTNYVLPGEKRPTGYPELDALLSSYQRTTASLGFA